MGLTVTFGLMAAGALAFAIIALICNAQLASKVAQLEEAVFEDDDEGEV